MPATQYACPVENCLTFPYETPADLEWHIANGRHAFPPFSPHEVAMETARPAFGTGAGSTGQAADGPTEAQLKFIATLAAEKAQTVEAPATKREASKLIEHLLSLPTPAGTPRADAPSDKQVAFALSLYADRDIAPEIANDPDLETKLRAMSKREVSAIIDSLTRAPKRTTATAPATAVPEGLHKVGDTVYRVRTSKTGNPYAERLTGTSWTYEGRRPLAGLSAATALTLEEAMAYGRQTGVCCSCARELTNPESIELGIGPICRAKF